jgi:hypothetical protein
VLTRQHVAPEYSRRYIAEFIRVCAPGGAVYSQITSRPVRAPRRSRYPPTLLKSAWRRANAFLALRPAMEMHSLSCEEVGAVVRAASGELVFVDAGHGAGQDFESCVYLARKP